MLFCRIWKSSDLSPRSNIKDTLEKTRVNSLESASNHNLQVQISSVAFSIAIIAKHESNYLKKLQNYILYFPLSLPRGCTTHVINFLDKSSSVVPLEQNYSVNAISVHILIHTLSNKLHIKPQCFLVCLSERLNFSDPRLNFLIAKI